MHDLDVLDIEPLQAGVNAPDEFPGIDQVVLVFR